MPITRRELLRVLGMSACTGGAVLLRPARAPAEAMAHVVVRASERSAAPAHRVGLVLGDGSVTARSTRDGVVMGVEEAARTAALLGGATTLVAATEREATSDPAAAARRLVEREGAHAIVGGDGETAAAALADVAEALSVPFLNVGATSDTLRRARCGAGYTFHVEASERMYDDAISLAPADAPGARARLWHDALERYGAAQLNDRFRARFGRGMDGPAWAGWFAVKALWESAARGAGAMDGPRLSRALATQRFDGHKGRRLSFRAWDGQLRQPLYLVRRDATTAAPIEVPTAARGEQVDPDALLDRLGAPAPAGGCTGGAR